MRVAVVAVMMIAGCGDDGGSAASDAGVDAMPGGCDATSELHARFVIIGEVAVRGPMGNQASGAYMSGTSPQTIATLAEAGGCRFVGPRPALCDPPCAGEDLCDVEGRCVRYPDVIPAGTMTITGTTPPLTLEPEADGNSYRTPTSYPQLYRPGDVLTLALAGAAGVAPLHAEVIGVPSIALPTDQLTAIEHQDLVIAWTPVAQPADAEVVVHLDNDHHGIAAYLECRAPASAGSLTVPAAILDRLILAGETGIGTYIEHAWIELRHRALRTTERGCAAVDAYSDHFLLVDTVRAP